MPKPITSTATTPVPYLPPECLLMIFFFIKPYEEFPLAMVCREWYNLLSAKRLKRGHREWTTWIGCLVNTLPRLKWARKNAGLPWTDHICGAAALCGNLNILKWAQRRWLWSKNTCTFAAQNGHLAVLKWARQHSFSWDEHTCSAAARNGHLAVLQWLRNHGCPWDTFTCVNAARSGHLEVLRWAVDNQCPQGGGLLYYAANRGHIHVVEWLVSGTSVDRLQSEIMPWLAMLAVKDGRLPLLEWSVEWLMKHPYDRPLGISASSVFNSLHCAAASERGHLHVLKWLRERGCPWDQRTVDHAKTKEIRAWAIENGCPTGVSTTDV